MRMSRELGAENLDSMFINTETHRAVTLVYVIRSVRFTRGQEDAHEWAFLGFVAVLLTFCVGELFI